MDKINNLFVSINKDPLSLTEEKGGKIIEKQEGKCFCCGFSFSHNPFFIKEEENKKVRGVCSLCYYTMSLNDIPTQNKGAIILMPHLSQLEINSIVRACWYVNSLDSDFDEEKDLISVLMEQFEQRSWYADRYYSSGITDVNLLVQLFFEMDRNTYLKRRVGSLGLRWLPNEDLFHKDIEAWKTKDFSRVPIEKWKELVTHIKYIANKKSKEKVENES